jgi:antitoxin (DNA-binding transcriptional repressor) of toxin-antitoxin stability system
MTLTASRLRENVYKVLDSVLETGKPVEIERNGRVLRIVADPPPGSSKRSRITKRPGLINGDPKDLAEIDWSKEWNPDGNF